VDNYPFQHWNIMLNDPDPKLLMLLAKVVDSGGISSASRLLGIPKATVSRGLSTLEASLGTRLMERTSRKMRLTESGETIYGHSQRIAEEIEQAKAAIGSLQSVVRGRLRIASPLTFGRSLLSPALPKFLAQHPQLHVEVELTNRRVDPVEEDFDFVIRLGPLADSSLVAKSLGEIRFLACASPAYLKSRAKLQHPEDLVRHAVIDFFQGAARHHWEFLRGEERVKVEVVPRFDANDPIVRRDAAIAGIGISLLPSWVARDAVSRGQLQIVLPQWQPALTNGIYALFPNRRSLSAKSRSFLSFLETEMPPRMRGEIGSSMEWVSENEHQALLMSGSN
jgi:DNA-binding transcriptional LysR family regulator